MLEKKKLLPSNKHEKYISENPIRLFEINVT